MKRNKEGELLMKPMYNVPVEEIHLSELYKLFGMLARIDLDYTYTTTGVYSKMFHFNSEADATLFRKVYAQFLLEE